MVAKRGLGISVPFQFLFDLMAIKQSEMERSCGKGGTFDEQSNIKETVFVEV